MNTIQRLNAMKELVSLMIRDGDVLRIGLPTDDEIEAAPDLAAARMERVTVARRDLAERALVLSNRLAKHDPDSAHHEAMQWARRVYSLSS